MELLSFLVIYMGENVMIIRYYMIESELKSGIYQQINLGGEWSFYFSENRLACKENKNYVPELYAQFNVIEDISCLLYTF